jgi:acid phosphatase (class A)
MRAIRFSGLALALILAACTTSQPEKFPYPPQFVTTEQVSIYSLPAPPQPGSAEYKRGVNTILAKQKTLTRAEIADIKQQVHIKPEMIVQPVLGDEFTAENYPALYSLLKHAGSDAWRINDNVQDHWNETRPWLADARIKRYVEPIYRPGYPSGHTVTNGTWANILAELLPCKEEALFDRAWSVGHNRVWGGAHFPHDIEAGKKMAKIIFHRMMESEQFQLEFAAARAELAKKLPNGIATPGVASDDTGFAASCIAAPRSTAMQPTVH